MKHSIRYALDWLFMFMLIVSLIVLGMQKLVTIPHSIIQAVESIDFAILGGYYILFLHGLVKSRSKTSYIKNNMVFVILLLLPFVPFARTLKLTPEIARIGQNSLWHILDRTGLL